MPHRASVAAVAGVRHLGRPASPARSDPRHQRARRPGLLPGAEVRARPPRSVRGFAERARGDVRRLVPQREDGVLGERLQRLRAADGRSITIRSSGSSTSYPSEQHPADSGCVRVDRATAPRDGASRSMRSRRRSCPSSRNRASISRSAAARSAAAGCGARRTPARASRSSSTRSRRSSCRNGPCSGSIGQPARCRSRRS